MERYNAVVDPLDESKETIPEYFVLVGDNDSASGNESHIVDYSNDDLSEFDGIHRGWELNYKAIAKLCCTSIFLVSLSICIFQVSNLRSTKTDSNVIYNDSSTIPTQKYSSDPIFSITDIPSRSPTVSPSGLSSTDYPTSDEFDDNKIDVEPLHWCGASRTEAKTCSRPCPSGNHSECTYNHKCHKHISTCGSKDKIQHRYCGHTKHDAASTCRYSCPEGEDASCPQNMKCFRNVHRCSGVFPSGSFLHYFPD